MPAVRMSVHEWVIQHFRLGRGRPVSIFFSFMLVARPYPIRPHRLK